MSIFKNKWFFLLLNIVLTFLLFLFVAPTFNFLNYINTLFYICFIYLIVALLLFVIKGKFIDGITYGFRRFRVVMSKKEDYLDEWQDKPYLSEKVNIKFYRSVFFQAIFLFLILLVLLFVYYV